MHRKSIISLVFAIAPLLLAARCDEPGILTTGQRQTAEAVAIQTAVARGTCPGWDSCDEGD